MSPNPLQANLEVLKVQRPSLCQHCRFFKRATIVPIDEYKPIVTFTCTRKDCDNHIFVDRIPVKHFQILSER